MTTFSFKPDGYEMDPNPQHLPYEWQVPYAAYDGIKVCSDVYCANHAKIYNIWRGSWSDYLILTCSSPQPCDSFEFYHWREDSDIRDMQIDFYYSGEWHSHYSGVFLSSSCLNEEPAVLGFKKITIEKVRMRYLNTNPINNWSAVVLEVGLQVSAEPVRDFVTGIKGYIGPKNSTFKPIMQLTLGGVGERYTTDIPQGTPSQVKKLTSEMMYEIIGDTIKLFYYNALGEKVYYDEIPLTEGNLG